MNQEFYDILKISPEATDEELEASYQALKAEYERDRWLPGEAGTLAARSLDKLNTAYREIKTLREEEGKDQSDVFAEISALIRDKKLDEAQEKLDGCNERGAEWHYLQSAVFHRKSWFSDSKKQLEIAMQMDGGNEKYKEAYRKLNEQIEEEKNSAKREDMDGEAPSDAEQMGGMGGNCANLCYSCICGTCLYNLCCNCR